MKHFNVNSYLIIHLYQASMLQIDKMDLLLVLQLLLNLNFMVNIYIFLLKKMKRFAKTGII